MRTVLQNRTFFACRVAFITGVLTVLMTSTSHANTFEDLRACLPQEITGWAAVSQDRIFDPKTIFSYINGGAEVYKAYNMRQCLSRRYAKTGGPAIILDVFDMGAPQDAFGVFTHDTDGKVVDIGQDARFRSGWLSFWKHRYFVSLYAEEETAAAEKAVNALGRAVAACIPGKGAKPDILLKLPAEGLESENIRYLHHPTILNYHFYLSDENILNISPETKAVLANYQRGKETARLLLISYPDKKRAKKSRDRFLKHYLTDADKMGMAVLEDGKWAAACLKNRLLAIVLEADSRQLAEHLLKPFL
ncbi:MAG: hypothetical protein PVI71_01300 [Desulfobacterales bacterium]|jgi:hypothetical protein